ncbi:MAG: hypothetical protein KDD22_05940, partial [Bdellovibrionales bacterium]|nr:hypothetical protein [Bdellovibrionales bacterium]
RYPSPDVIINMLQASFPTVKMSVYEDLAKCWALTKSNRSVLGDSSPATGRPAVERPNSSFIVWYSGCLAKLLESEKQSLSPSSADQDSWIPFMNYLGDEMVEACRATPTDYVKLEDVDLLRWWC